MEEKRMITVADPTPLGLFGLAMVTLVAASQKLGLTEGVSLVIPWAIFLGASAQLYASIQDAKKNNMFGATAFGGYAFFWFSVAMTWMTKAGVFGETLANTADTKQLGIAFIGYLIFTLYMTVGSLTTNKVLFLIFFFINFLFIGLSFSTLGILEGPMHQLAAYAEFVISLLSFYGSAALIINGQFGKTILPMGAPIIVKAE
ncbi:acetate uptake transporter [Petrocella sp. FN5]|uniref:acetate uptake transporter n=1 Tax=Petrocella sp. FN5 TaxID=3032002 RepID=UPI0023DCE4DC|nr:acetate uptake transporter [Petrocella sp. FN5]MDF1616212.1 acetate uptake transporter [Petrocella sp. FN5]